MNLVVIPFHDWKKCEEEGFRTRDAHLMQEFAKHATIDKLLIINRPLSWAEMILKRRPRYPRRGKLLYHHKNSYLCQVDTKTYTLDIVVPELLYPLWLQRKWTSYIFGKKHIAQCVTKALQWLEIIDSYHMFLSAPLFVPLVQNLKPSSWSFDALDNLLKQPFYRDTPNLQKFYEYALENAHCIFANSAETTQWFKEKRPDAQWIANGVDTEIFAPKRYSRPPDMHHIAPLTVGYAGKMQEMVDVEMLETAFAQFPNLNFVFIGQQLNPKWVEPLWKHSNAYYLGDKPYQLLPQYLSAFDICMIPYSIAHQHGGDPIKFYEYLAMGKPIVTTEIGGVGRFKEYPQVVVAQTSAQFLDGLHTLSSKLNMNQTIEKREVPQEHLWKTKATQMLTCISTTI